MPFEPYIPEIYASISAPPPPPPITNDQGDDGRDDAPVTNYKATMTSFCVWAPVAAASVWFSQKAGLPVVMEAGVSTILAYIFDSCCTQETDWGYRSLSNKVRMVSTFALAPTLFVAAATAMVAIGEEMHKPPSLISQIDRPPVLACSIGDNDRPLWPITSLPALRL